MLRSVLVSGFCVLVLSIAEGRVATLEFPGRVVPIARPGESVEALIRNLPAATPEVDSPALGLVARDWLGREEKVPLTVLSSDADTLRVRFDPPFLGWMELGLDTGGESPVGFATRLAVVPEAKSKGTWFRYGISDHSMTLGGSMREKALVLLDEMGVDIAREDVSWHRVKTGPDAPWNFSLVDRMLEDYAARGIEMQPILNYGVEWATTATDPKDARRTMPLMGPWLDYVRTMVGRYKDRVRYWEIWNEPDIPFWKSTTAQYVELFDRTGAEIAALQPDALIMNGGLAMVSRQPNPDFTEQFIAQASPAHWHLRAWHDYNTFGEMIARHRRHEALYRQHARPEVAALPSWMNEGGYHTIDPGKEAEQARTIVKKVSTAPALGFASYFVYTTRDSSTNRRTGAVAPFYGLSDYDCIPKPAFAAYNRLIAETAHLRYEAPKTPIDAADGFWRHLYADPESGGASDGNHVLVVWREAADLRSPVWLRWAHAEVTAILDIMGNPVAFTPVADGIVVGIGTDPLYVRLKGAPDYPDIKPMISTPELLSLIPGGEASTLEVRIENPTSQPLSCRARIAADSSLLEVAESTVSISLAPGESRVVSFLIKVGTAATRLPRGGITISLETEGATGVVEATLPYEVATVVSLDESIPFVLTRRTDVRNLHEGLANPAMEWHGPEDLSATGEWRVTEDGLQLTVTVSDQTHHQPFARETLWQADSLQFAFRASDSQTDHVEIVLALDAQGSSQGWVLNNPGWSRFGKGNLRRQADFSVRRTEGTTIYDLALSWKSLGYDGRPSSAWRASFIVNDDDGAGRKQWLQLSRGIGESKDPMQYPLFLYKN